jgi:hypothetical protein
MRVPQNQRIEEALSEIRQALRGPRTPMGSYFAGETNPPAHTRSTTMIDCVMCGNTGYVVLHHDDEVNYFVRHRPLLLAGAESARRIAVCRVDAAVAAIGFALHAIFNILLPRYRVIARDEEQFHCRHGFWDYALASAFKQDLRVYWRQQSSGGDRLILLETWAQLLASNAGNNRVAFSSLVSMDTLEPGRQPARC